MTRLLTPMRLLAAAIALSWPAALSHDAAAQDKAAQASPEGLFDRLDTNGDGEVTKDEVGEDNQQRFAFFLRRGDQNKDGKLTQAEFAEALRGPQAGGRPPTRTRGSQQFGGMDRGAMFRRLDANSDGKLSKSELPERGREFLLRFDADADGALSKKEFEAVSAPGQSRGGQTTPGGGDAAAQSLFRALDTDGDGAISSEEQAAAPEALTKLDRDGDGKLSRAELSGKSMALDRALESYGARLRTSLKELDTNGDKMLSKDEARGTWKDRFVRFDANRDDFITEAEIRRMLSRIRAERGRDRRPNR